MVRQSTRDDSIEEILFDLACIRFFKRLEKKYHNSRLGFAMAETLELLKKKIASQAKAHHKEHGEELIIQMWVLNDPR
jgi:hypothetical protein